MQIHSVHLVLCGCWRFDVTYCIYLTRMILLSFFSSSDLEFIPKHWVCLVFDKTFVWRIYWRQGQCVTRLYMNTVIRNWICNPHCSRNPRTDEPLWPAETSSFSFSTFRVRPSGLFPIRINLELCISYTVGKTPWMGDQPCRKAYAEEHKHRSISDRHPCFEWDSKPRSRCLNRRRHSLDRAVTVIGERRVETSIFVIKTPFRAPYAWL
jgi:hypothetical protein